MQTPFKKDPVDVWVVDPIKGFIHNSSASGVILFGAAVVALLWSNSPWHEYYHHLWETPISISIGESFVLNKSLHHWINDGLVSIFFFVIGLELKREIIAGELRNPRQALLPLAAAMGGMILPALIYIIINPTSPDIDGWGIPMATDIAFALGVLYLLGDKVPIMLKVFLTTLAIADDLGAVLVIAFFYTSEIDVVSLYVGGVVLIMLITANQLGVRHSLFYAIIGIGGLWLTFLLSGIHPTIAAVLVAFTIPASTKVSSLNFSGLLSSLLSQFKKAKTIEDAPIVSNERLKIVKKIRKVSKMAVTPLQRLEQSMHPFVAFIVMPIFALSNAGVYLGDFTFSQLLSNVPLGILLGLVIGKVAGIFLMVKLLQKFGVVTNPSITDQQLLGLGFLAAIGFTMSLFIADLAFSNPELIAQAKIGILTASIISAVIGYFLIRKTVMVESSE